MYNIWLYDDTVDKWSVKNTEPLAAPEAERMLLALRKTAVDRFYVRALDESLMPDSFLSYKPFTLPIDNNENTKT